MKIVASASGQSYRIRANAMGGGGTSLFYIMFIYFYLEMTWNKYVKILENYQIF